MCVVSWPVSHGASNAEVHLAYDDGQFHGKRRILGIRHSDALAVGTTPRLIKKIWNENMSSKPTAIYATKVAVVQNHIRFIAKLGHMLGRERCVDAPMTVLTQVTRSKSGKVTHDGSIDCSMSTKLLGVKVSTS